MGSSIAEIGIRVFLDNLAGAGLRELGMQLANLGLVAGFAIGFLAFATALKFVVKAAMDLQTAMFGVAIATHVPLALAMQYAPVLMNLGAASIFTTAQIADGIVQLGRSGYSLQDIMGKTKDGMSGMAAAGVALSIAIRTDTV